MIQLTHLGRRTYWNAGDWLPVVSSGREREPTHRAYPKLKIGRWRHCEGLRDAAERMHATWLAVREQRRLETRCSLARNAVCGHDVTFRPYIVTEAMTSWRRNERRHRGTWRTMPGVDDRDDAGALDDQHCRTNSRSRVHPGRSASP